MANKSAYKFNIRDGLIAVLFIMVLATNFAWYQSTQGLYISAGNSAKAYVYTEEQIGKLQQCIAQGTRTCDLSRLAQP